ncbi:MAG: hypothetical protein AMK71_12795 [Nitrospira bacterium SG8_35_4]|nr:MAG: hypothetical protein AMK71_12795 [Nitrospira bacterium SG8_35_4]
MKTLAAVILFLGGVLYCSSLSLAGNKQMVEQSVAELDELNRQAVRQIPDLPESGQVRIKADVTYEKDSPVFDIHYREVTGEKEGTLDFGGTKEEKSIEKGKVKNNDEQDN